SASSRWNREGRGRETGGKVTSRGRAWSLVLVLHFCVALSSCATVALWGGSMMKKEATIATDEAGFDVDFSETGMHTSHWTQLLYRIPLTPLTVAFDVVTSPIQLVALELYSLNGNK